MACNTMCRLMRGLTFVDACPKVHVTHNDRLYIVVGNIIKSIKNVRNCLHSLIPSDKFSSSMSAETYPAISDPPPLLKRPYHLYLYDPRSKVADIKPSGLATLRDHTWDVAHCQQGASHEDFHTK